MKSRLLIIIILFVIFIFSCKKEEITNTPILSVNPSLIVLNDENKEACIIISNTGKNELFWEIESMPNWLTVSKSNGSIISEQDTIIVTTKVGLEIGDYSSDIIINSNGGKAIINVALSVEYNIEIFPGKGAAKVNLGDSYETVEQIYGNPNRHLLVKIWYPSDNIIKYWHYLYYDSIKVVFGISNYSSGFFSNDTIMLISVEYPYDGVTEKYIGIGSTSSDIINAYGVPFETFTGSNFYYYDYDTLGIRFYFDEGNTVITKIYISYPKTYPDNIIKDIDGNEYNTVTIGSQVWMKENLKTTHYSDGSPIDSVFDHPDGSDLYGRLYHWPAAMKYSTTESTQGACPSGWHIPSKTEFDKLIDYLGGKEVAGGKLKATGTTLWWEPNEGATNESGFTALPAGWNGYAIGMGANFWSSTKQSDTYAYRYEVSYDTEEVNHSWGDVGGINEGISVRCIKD